MKDRYELSIKYGGTNKTMHLTSYGNNIWEVIENMLLEELDYFQDEYENNNIENGGHTAFTIDAKKLYEELGDIRNDLRIILGWKKEDKSKGE